MKLEHLLEQRSRSLGAHLLLVTIRDACEITKYRREKKYKYDFKAQFGFGPNGDVEETFQRVSQRIDGWVASDNFFVITTKLGLDPAPVKQFIRDILSGERLDEIEEHIEQLQEEVHRYVWNEQKNQSKRHAKRRA